MGSIFKLREKLKLYIFSKSVNGASASAESEDVDEATTAHMVFGNVGWRSTGCTGATSLVDVGLPARYTEIFYINSKTLKGSLKFVYNLPPLVR